jgi:serine/threonine protein kinase
MDLVNGRDLERVVRAGPVTAIQAAAWIAEGAGIVHFAHERGIIHCDLKPSNLLVDERGKIRVTDFGLAIPLAQAASPAALLAGTPAFMAPEQADAAWGSISPRTDVYGLGAVLYFLLFGRPPHAGRGVDETLAQVAADVPVAVPQEPHQPAWLLGVLAKCLARRQEDRWPSAAALASALQP